MLGNTRELPGFFGRHRLFFVFASALTYVAMHSFGGDVQRRVEPHMLVRLARARK